jgi:hypothetical protein
VSEKLGQFAVTHLKCKELVDALLSREGQTCHQFGLQCGVGLSFRCGGDDILYFHGIPVVRLQDHSGT